MNIKILGDTTTVDVEVTGSLHLTLTEGEAEIEIDDARREVVVVAE